MGTSCWVPDCNHRNGRDKCTMFAFPRDYPTKTTWKELIRRAKTNSSRPLLASPKRSARVCSCHFKDGKRESLPTILPWNGKNSCKGLSPLKRPKKPFHVRSLSFDGSAETDTASDHQSFASENQSFSSDGQIFLSSSQSSGSGSSFASRSAPVSNASKNEATSTEELEARFVQENKFLKNMVRKLKKKLAETSKSKDETRSTEGLEALIVQENAFLKEKLSEMEKKLTETTTVLYAAENTILKIEVEKLKEELDRNRNVFLFKVISNKDELVSHFIGLPNRQTFYALLHLFDNIEIQYAKGWKVKRLDRENQLFLTLLKLRRGLSNYDLASRFQVEKTTVANVFLTWLMALHHVIVKSLMLNVPSRKKNQRCLPKCFEEYPNTRIILDCTEVTTANPTLLSKQSKMYSSYKHRITAKALVGIAPNGTVTYVSELYGGSVSDRSIVIDCGIVNILVPGNTVMADKGFNIEDLMPDGVTINIPPFKDAPQFTVDQVDLCFGIATARIHVERAIARIKNFQILNYISQNEAPYASEIFQVCAALTNFQNPLIKEVDDEEE